MVEWLLPTQVLSTAFSSQLAFCAGSTNTSEKKQFAAFDAALNEFGDAQTQHKGEEVEFQFYATSF